MRAKQSAYARLTSSSGNAVGRKTDVTPRPPLPDGPGRIHYSFTTTTDRRSAAGGDAGVMAASRILERTTMRALEPSYTDTGPSARTEPWRPRVSKARGITACNGML